MLPLLRREAEVGRMPPLAFARNVDRSRLNRGLRQPYGTTRVLAPATGTLGPPVVAPIAATNAARGEIGLPPLTDVVEAD